MYKTFNQHQLLLWAEQQGLVHDFKMGFFTAHFTRECNLSDNAVLADAAV